MYLRRGKPEERVMHSSVEKVARAIHAHAQSRFPVLLDFTWEELPDETKCALAKKAKTFILATLDAIREPTPAMVKAAWAPVHDEVWAPVHDEDAAETWREMIG